MMMMMTIDGLHHCARTDRYRGRVMDRVGRASWMVDLSVCMKIVSNNENEIMNNGVMKRNNNET
jgi:hypothetical protein